MTNRIERLAFSPEETANRLGVSLRMVHYAIKRGDVATRKLGRRVLRGEGYLPGRSAIGDGQGYVPPYQDSRASLHER